MNDGAAENKRKAASFARDAKVCGIVAAACAVLASLTLVVVDYLFERQDDGLANDVTALAGFLVSAAGVVGLGGAVRLIQAGRAVSWFGRTPGFAWLVGLRPVWGLGRAAAWLLLAAALTAGAWFALKLHARALVRAEWPNPRAMPLVIPDSVYPTVTIKPSPLGGGSFYIVPSPDGLVGRVGPVGPVGRYHRFMFWRAFEDGRAFKNMKESKRTMIIEVLEILKRAREALQAAAAAPDAAERKEEAVQALLESAHFQKAGEYYRLNTQEFEGMKEGGLVFQSYSIANLDAFNNLVMYDLQSGAVAAAYGSSDDLPESPWWVHGWPWQTLLFLACLALLFPCVFLRTPRRGAGEGAGA